MFDPSDYLNDVFGGSTGVAGETKYANGLAAGAANAAFNLGNFGAGQLNAYVNNYQPYDRKFMGYVDNLGTDAYRAQQRGQAMTDVGIQGGQQIQAMNRNMARMGVNPNSGQFALMNGQMAQQNALNKVMAAMQADRGARDEWAKGLGAINAMGVNVGKLGMAGMDAAGNMGKVGMAAADLGNAASDRYSNAVANMTGASASAQNASTAATNAANQYQLGLGKLALERMGMDQNQAKFDWLKSQGGLDNVFASQLAGGLATGLGTGLTKAAGNAFNSWLNGGSSGGQTYTQSDGSFSVVPPGSFDMPTDSSGFDYFFQ